VSIDVPLPQGPLRIEHVVFDLNGTLARDGVLVDGVAALVEALAARVDVRVASGDTHGTARACAQELGLPLVELPELDQAEAKRALVLALGPERTAMVGNGANDAEALRTAVCGICVLDDEGAAAAAVAAADAVVTSPGAAIELLLRPLRLVATLRT
jgi:P-type E1-E2 ATPase